MNNKSTESVGSEYQYDIFISYSREDTASAEALSNYLSEVGFQVFWDPHIKEGVPWKDTIEDKIRNKCAATLICWSKYSVESRIVHWEAEIARDAETAVMVTLDDTIPKKYDYLNIPTVKNWDLQFRPRNAQELALRVLELVGSGRDIDVGDVERRIQERASATRISNLWFVVAVIAFYYSLSMWIASQNQGNSPLGLLIDSRPIPGSLIAFFVVAIFLGISLKLVRAHARMFKQDPWLERLPRFVVEPKGNSDWFARTFGWTKVIVQFLPFVAFIHFTRKVVDHGSVAICDKHSEPVPIHPFSIPETIFGHHYCFGQGYEVAAREGVTYIPLVEPVIMVLLGLWVTVELIRTLGALCARS